MTNSLNKLQKAVSSANKLCKMFEVDAIIPLGFIVVDYYREVLQHHGDRTATNQLKAIYNEACHFVVGQVVEPSTPIWVKRSKVTKLPKKFKPFEPYLSSKVVLEKRLALTMLRTFESIVLEPVPDLESVITPSLGAEGFAEFQEDFNFFLENSKFGFTIKKLFSSESSNVRNTGKTFHYSAKGGIAGPTIGNCGKQSLAINEELMKDLDEIGSVFRKDNISDFIKVNQEFYKDRNDIVDRGSDLIKTRLGRLAFIPDKGGKTRLIAIGNYWIQEVFHGLHNTIYRMLRRLRQDGTYNQTSASDVVCKATSNKDVWSWDLTAATDRFPVQPQQIVLNFLDKRLSNWSKILTSIGFEYKGSQYTYKVGQPMGLYGSWATFALTHHAIIQYVAWSKGFKTFKSYRILGDDVAIWNKQVATGYSDIIRKLDVRISDAKSIIPDNQCKPGHSAEFAKRIFYNGSEYTGIAPNILMMAEYSFWSIPSLFEYLDLRSMNVGGIPVSRIKDIYRLHDKQVLNLCRCFHLWSIIRRSLISDDELTEYIPEFVNQVDYQKVVSTRYNLLMETAEDALYDLMTADSEFRADLEEVLGDPIPDDLCFFKIIQSRIDEVDEIMDQLATNQIYVSNNFEVNYLNRYGNKLRISDLEFVPHLTYDEIKSEISDRIPKRVRYGKYLAKLVARVELLESKGSIDFYEDDDTSLF